MNLKDNKLLKLLSNIIKGITTLLIILVVLIIVLQRVSNGKITLGGYSIFIVVTESMVPKYNVGDMLLAKKIDINNIKVGDDVVYLGNTDTFAGKIVTHRVVDIEGNNSNKIFHTKGINNIIEDPTITGSQIQGKVVTKLTILSILTKIINNQYGFFFIIVIPLVILIFGVIMDVINDKKKS